MKVVHVVRQYAPSVGGLEEAVSKLCAALRVHGIEAKVVTLDRLFQQPNHRLPRCETIGGTPVSRIAWRGSSRYPLAPAILRMIEDADVVHVHAIDFFFDFLAATRPLHRKPLVASTHGGFFHTGFASAAKRVWFTTVTRASCTAYHAIAGSSQDDAEMFGRVAGDKVRALPNGVDTNKWANAAAPVLVPRMIFVGRFSTNKRIPALIDLIAALRRRGCDWRLTVAGSASDLSAEALRRRADVMNVADAIGIVENPDDDTVRRLIGRASFFASASEYEGFGISAVEGLSAGLIPLLGDIGPFRRLIEQAGCGLLFDPTDIEASAHRIDSIYAQLAENGAVMARKAARDAARVFDWHIVAGRFAQLYRAASFGDVPVQADVPL